MGWSVAGWCSLKKEKRKNSYAARLNIVSGLLAGSRNRNDASYSVIPAGCHGVFLWLLRAKMIFFKICDAICREFGPFFFCSGNETPTCETHPVCNDLLWELYWWLTHVNHTALWLNSCCDDVTGKSAGSLNGKKKNLQLINSNWRCFQVTQ